MELKEQKYNWKEMNISQLSLNLMYWLI